MCLSALSVELSVIMTGLYERPCFQAFRCALAFSEMDVPLIELFHSNGFHLLIRKHINSCSSPSEITTLFTPSSKDPAPILLIIKIFSSIWPQFLFSLPGVMRSELDACHYYSRNSTSVSEKSLKNLVMM